MGSFILALLFTAVPTEAPKGPSGEPAPVLDVLGKAITGCPLNKRPTEEQIERLERLLRIEDEEGLPPFARGLILAAACQESAYKLRVSCGDKGASCGVLQLHGSHKRRLREMGAEGDDPRLDYEVAGRYWLQLLKRMRRLARRDCKGKGGYATRERYVLWSANKTATWAYACAKWGRCRECKVCLRWGQGGKCTECGECAKRYCVRQAARCSVPPWRWRKNGKHRRQETKHVGRLRAWREGE